MAQTPTQADADYLAHYIQAARDMSDSPFFTEGQTSLGMTSSQRRDGSKSPIAYRVPDPRVRDSVIVPFRRMWMTGEPANFDRVGNIIKRYWPQARPYIDHFKGEMKKTKAEYQPARFTGLMDGEVITISPEDVIDLWLNCRLAHVGGKPAKGRFARADFDSYVNTFGDAKFEYMFMLALHNVGLWFINLTQFAEQLLGQWSKTGIEPTFDFDNITAEGSVNSNSQDTIERHTPGVTIDPSDVSTRLALLCRRKKYSEISKLLEIMETSKTENVDFVRDSNDVEELVAKSGLGFRSVDSFDDISIALRFTTISDDFTDMSKHPWRKGAITVCTGEIMVAEGDALEILTEQLTELKGAL